MALNLIAAADSLKNLSDAQLRQTYMGGQVPQFLVLTEMQNRLKMRQAYTGQDPQAAGNTTIADKLLSGVGALPTSASIAANAMLAGGQDPGSPGADAAVPPGGNNPSATGMGGITSMGPGGGTPMKPPAPGGNAQGFNMGMSGSPKGFAKGGAVDNEDRGSPPPGSAEMGPEFDQRGFMKGRIWSDDDPRDLIPPRGPDYRYSNAFTPKEGGKSRGPLFYDPKVFWRDRDVGIHQLYEPGKWDQSDFNKRRHNLAEGGRVGYADRGAVVQQGIVTRYPFLDVVPQIRPGGIAEELENREQRRATQNSYDPTVDPSYMQGGNRSEYPTLTAPPPSLSKVAQDSTTGENLPGSTTPYRTDMPATDTMPTDSVQNENLPGSTTPFRTGDETRPRPAPRSGGGGGGGGGSGAPTAGGGGSAGSRSGIRGWATELSDLFPERFGEAEKDVERQRKELAEAKSDNVSNAMIRMGSAMMEGGAKSGNFLGIVGLGVRSGQDEMTLRQAQQEKMRQAITEGSLKVATGRTVRDDALARGATTLTATDMTNATHLEVARMQADAQLKAAAMRAAASGGGGSKVPLLAIAAAIAKADGREGNVTKADIAMAGETIKPPAGTRDATEIMAEGFARNAGIERPTDAMWQRASELTRGQGPAARDNAADLKLADDITKEVGYVTAKTQADKDAYLERQFRLRKRLAAPPPNVADR